MGSILDELRRAIRQAERRGITRYRLAKITGVTETMLGRFVSGERGLSVPVVEKVAAGLGLVVVLKAKR